MSSALGPTEKDTCREYVVPRLEASGWAGSYQTEVPVVAPASTAARKHGRAAQDGRADYVLEVVPGVPIAVVEAKRLYRKHDDGLQQGVEYARRLDVPLVYATNGTGIRERDMLAGTERDLESFPTPAEVWSRYVEVNALGGAAQTALQQPFNRRLINGDGSIKELRSYQRTAVHRVLRAIASGDQRVLLLMATGTGKTFTALQVVAKLQAYWSATEPGRNRKVLYLADRDSLVDQPIRTTFREALPEGSVTRVRGATRMGHDVFFATYQALDQGSDPDSEAETLFQAYPEDFFDLVVVDECHRGSATRDSRWRAVLDHFASAVQVGLTATPKQEDDVDTYAYFGAPVFEYSLRQGIEDGYLAPYRVRRVVLSTDVDGWRPDEGQLDVYGKEVPDDLYTPKQFERVVALLTRTAVVAQHLSELLRAAPAARALVFCVDIAHAQRMRDALVAANPDRVAEEPFWVVRITGEDGETGRRLLEDFCDPESRAPVVVTTSRMLSTGVDVQDLTHVVLFRPVGSMVEFKQIVGRGSRLFPEKGKASFEIVDYVDATQLFDDPAFDGPAVRRIVETVDDDGAVVDETEEPVDAGVAPSGAEAGTDGAADIPLLEEPVPEYTAGGSGTVGTDDEPHPGGSRTYLVDGVVVALVAEGFYVPDTTTGRLRLVEYTDYVRDRVVALAPDVETLRSHWTDRRLRHDLVSELAVQGIDLRELQERTGLLDTDPFDLLVQAAWHSPPLSRRQRAERARAGLGTTEDLDVRAREVLDLLLDRYADKGVDEVADQHVLEVPPLSSLGNVIEITRRFGGAAGYRDAVSQLQRALYSA